MILQSWKTVLVNLAPGILAAVFYGIVSGSMSFMNKVVLTTYSYHFPDVVMLFQIITTSTILELCRITKLCTIPAWNLVRGKEFALPSLCFALHTTLALAALDDLSIPIYNVLRRMLPLATLIMAIIVLKKTPSRGTLSAVVLIVSGTLFAGLGDMQFHLIGYGDAILSVLAQSMYLTYVQKTGVERGISALSVLHLNSINCIPIMLLYTGLSGHLQKGLAFQKFSQYSFSFYFLLNILLGCILNYSLFLCATMNSALTTSIVGVIKGVITTIIGFFTFGGMPVTFLTVGGVTLNAVGGLLYTYIKYRERQNNLQTLLPADMKVSRDENHTNKAETCNGMVTRHRHDSSSLEHQETNEHIVVDVIR